MAAGDVKANLTKVRAFACNNFDGVDDYVDVPHDPRQLGANLTEGFTISCWLNLKRIGEGGFTGLIIDKSTSYPAVNGFSILSFANQMAFNINNGTSAVSANNSITYGLWIHCLVTISSSQLGNWYVGGSLSGTANQNIVQTIAAITTTNNMRIGQTVGGIRNADGSIKDVKMWNRVLTAAEIASEAAGGHTMTGLLHWFKLGGDYADYGSVGVSATNSGSIPAVVDDAVAAVVKAQRVASTDKWMIYKGMGGQVGTVNIE